MVHSRIIRVKDWAFWLAVEGNPEFHVVKFCGPRKILRAKSSSPKSASNTEKGLKCTVSTISTIASVRAPLPARTTEARYTRSSQELKLNLCQSWRLKTTRKPRRILRSRMAPTMMTRRKRMNNKQAALRVAKLPKRRRKRRKRKRRRRELVCPS